MGKRGRREWEAFERFCALEYAAIVGSVALILGDADLAADSVNEAVARAWLRVKRGHDIETLGAWIRVVAVRVAHDEHRHRAVERKHLPKFEPTSRDNLSDAQWGPALDVRAALAALPRRQREVAVLRYLCEFPIATIADELQLSVGTVRTYLERAQVALTAALAEHRQEEVWHDAS